MKRFLTCVLILIAGAGAAAAQTLFNGENLEGWEGNPEFWRVEDGVIVGETSADKPTKGNTFLIWEGGDVGDFTLTLKARIIGNNSGVQVPGRRSSTRRIGSSAATRWTCTHPRTTSGCSMKKRGAASPHSAGNR